MIKRSESRQQRVSYRDSPYSSDTDQGRLEDDGTSPTLSASKRIKKRHSSEPRKRGRARRILWKPKEDQTLLQSLEEHGQKWTLIGKIIGGRSGKQVRDRYLNNLRPGINVNTAWTPEEDDKFTELYKAHGNKWAKIAEFMPGRTECQVKNRYYTVLRYIYAGKVRRKIHMTVDKGNDCSTFDGSDNKYDDDSLLCREFDGYNEEDLKQEQIYLKQEHIRHKDMKREFIQEPLKREEIEEEEDNEKYEKQDYLKQEDINRDDVKHEVKQEDVKREYIKQEETKQEHKEKHNQREFVKQDDVKQEEAVRLEPQMNQMNRMNQVNHNIQMNQMNQANRNNQMNQVNHNNHNNMFPFPRNPFLQHPFFQNLYFPKGYLPFKPNIQFN